ncbi:hypothetical protein [Desulfovibrio sp. JC010]|uniref:hypothetical protein n=1 Tax=Desulfovibrio sp. JC010 TaxID=2593641 RepID=UPI0013D1B39B|nr:hypothetical protein [Desulfovibrio sp. JC010]NDV27643.1 hypothetical protein [Desulfovibrio sp. JC010]
MRYIAALLSILLHILSVFILVDFVVPEYEQQNSFGIELVTLPKEKPDLKAVPIDKDSVRSNKEPRPEVVKPAKKLKPDLERKSVRIKQNKVRTKVEKKPEQVRQVEPAETVQGKGQCTRPVKNYPHIESGSSSNPDAVVLRQGKGITVGNSTMVLKRGSEARSLSGLAAYEFGEDDFRGHYETFAGRQVVIIDGRAEHGRLILHDHQSGLMRKLKKSEFGDFIYTYGPSFDEDEPIEGSVVFLPGDGHWIHRFMWMPEDGTAEYPVKDRDKKNAPHGPVF